jgi:hypothetical protein
MDILRSTSFLNDLYCSQEFSNREFEYLLIRVVKKSCLINLKSSDFEKE